MYVSWTFCSSWRVDCTVLCSKSRLQLIADSIAWWLGRKAVLPGREEKSVSSEKSGADLPFLGQWGHLDKLMDCRAARLLFFFPHRRQDRPFSSNLSHSAHMNGSFPSSKSSPSWGLSKSPSSALQVQRRVINCMLAFWVISALFWRSLAIFWKQQICGKSLDTLSVSFARFWNLTLKFPFFLAVV